MDDLAIEIRCAHVNHTDRGGRRVTFRVAAWDEQALADLKLVVPGQVVPDFQISDSDFIRHCDRPEGLAGFNHVEYFTIYIRSSDFHRDDQLGNSAGTTTAGIPARVCRTSTR